jgi:hypothetical protein
MSANWTARTSLDVVCRRAGGRNRYNARRRITAALRRIHVAESLRYRSVHDRGTQAALARELRVSAATISRDIKAIFGNDTLCRCCGRLQSGGMKLKPIVTGKRSPGYNL